MELGHADASRKYVVVVGDDRRTVFTNTMATYAVAHDADVVQMVGEFGK